jgi:hypothetical protein
MWIERGPVGLALAAAALALGCPREAPRFTEADFFAYLAANPPKVKVDIQKQGSTYGFRISNNGVGVCKHPQRCQNQFVFELGAGKPPISGAYRIAIETASGSAACLVPGPPYFLTEAAPTRTVAVSRDDTVCPETTKAAWMYTVSCQELDGSGTPTGDDCGVVPADPGVIIQGGPSG